jgi:hypothetical protein
MTKWKLGLAAFIAAGWLASGPAALAQDAADPKALELAAEVVDAAGMKAIAIQMMNQIGPSLTQLVVQANPGKEAAASDVMQHFVIPRIRDQVPELLHEAALLYAQHFSADELTQMVVFYKSPVGQKLVSEQPKMMQEMTVVSQAWGQKIALEALKAYSDEFKKRGLQTPI